MKQRNPSLAAILAFFVPLYYFYWWYDSGKRLQAKGIEKVPSIMPMISVVAVYSALIFGSSLHMEAGKSTEANPPASFYIALALIPVLYFLTVIFCYRFVKAANQVVNVTINPRFMAIIFFLLPPIGIYIYQKQFNTNVASSSKPPKFAGRK